MMQTSDEHAKAETNGLISELSVCTPAGGGEDDRPGRGDLRTTGRQMREHRLSTGRLVQNRLRAATTRRCLRLVGTGIAIWSPRSPTERACMMHCPRGSLTRQSVAP